MLAASAHAEVQDPDATPTITSSENQTLERVLSETWSHEEVLARLP